MSSFTFGFNVKPRRAGVSVDPDAQAFFTAASITDTTQKSAVNQLVLDLKSYNIWTKMKAVYPIVGGTAATHKFNLKNPLDTDAAFRLTFATGMTHSSTGMTGNGSSGYANTFANLFTNFSYRDVHYGYYIRNNVDNGGVFMGVTAGSPYVNEGWSDSKSNGNAIGGFYDNDSAIRSIKVANADARGFYVSSVLTSGTTFMTKNNTTLGTNTSTDNAGATTIYIGALHQASPNAALGYSNKETSFVSFGNGLTIAESYNFYTAVQTFQTTLSRNV